MARCGLQPGTDTPQPVNPTPPRPWEVAPPPRKALQLRRQIPRPSSGWGQYRERRDSGRVAPRRMYSSILSIARHEREVAELAGAAPRKRGLKSRRPSGQDAAHCEAEVRKPAISELLVSIQIVGSSTKSRTGKLEIWGAPRRWTGESQTKKGLDPAASVPLIGATASSANRSLPTRTFLDSRISKVLALPATRAFRTITRERIE